MIDLMIASSFNNLKLLEMNLTQRQARTPLLENSNISKKKHVVVVGLSYTDCELLIARRMLFNSHLYKAGVYYYPIYNEDLVWSNSGLVADEILRTKDGDFDLWVKAVEAYRKPEKQPSGTISVKEEELVPCQYHQFH